MSNQPGRFWRFRQRTTALIKTFSSTVPGDKNKAKSALRSTALSGLGAGATYAIAATPALMVGTLFIGPFVAGGATLVFGLMAFRNWQGVNRSLTVVRHMNEAKQKWVDKKSRPPLLKRIGTSFGNALSATARTLTAPLRWRPFKKNAPDAQQPRQLERAGNGTLDTSATIAGDLNTAAANNGPSEEQQAAAAKRAAARQTRKNTP